ncbi:MAG: DUF697 domain-containing protein [Ardenticatenaceae bacterium]
MSKREEADNIVQSHVLWSMGAGLIPLPLIDLAAVTAIQMDMLQELANLYEVEYSKSVGNKFATALTGSTFAKLGASLVKALPGIGSIIGGFSMSVVSGASTYAVGQITIDHFEANGDFSNLDLKQAKKAYKEAFEEGKEVVSNLEKEQSETSSDVFETLEQLSKLKDKGIITEEDFEAQKDKLLSRL